MILFFSILVIFLGALLAPIFGRGGKKGWSLLLAAPPLISFLLLAWLWFGKAQGGPISFSWDWFPALGVALDLRLDGLAALMALLVTGIGALVCLYATGYMKGHPQFGRFGLFLLLFMGSMLGLVLSDHLILLFVFWELTSITSYLLIGFNHEEESSRKKALQALLVTGAGAMAMLAGFILIGWQSGTMRISELGGLSGLLADSPYYTGIVILVLLGAFTKSAQTPFHFWLPNAMAAPTPVSAYLHSATMVKAGVFLMARLNPSLGDTTLWMSLLTCFGGATFLLAVALGLFQTDLKKILAYTTLGVLGLLTMLIGLGTEKAFEAMILFLLAHALYKACLFMTAGAVDHETGTRDVTILRGLRKAMPITALAAFLAVLSMSGFPPFLGFIGKEYVYTAGLELTGIPLATLLVAFVGNFIMMALAFKAGVSPFFGEPSDRLPKHPHEAPTPMWIGPVLLAVLGLVLGVFPSLIAHGLVSPAVSSIVGETVEVHVDLWHGFNPALAISAVTLVSGLLLYAARGFFWSRHEAVNGFLRPRGAEAVYDVVFNGVIRFSKYQTKALQSGYLHRYVFIIALATVGFLLWGYSSFGARPTFSLDLTFPDILFAGLVILMMISAVVAVLTTNRITALVNLGVVGFGIALLYVYFGAPDLAITQLMVETLTVVLLMLAIYRLPAMRHMASKKTRSRDAVLATVFGVLIAGLVLTASVVQVEPPISDELVEMSYSEAHGRDIVNVILVDFRALDTLGEITVLSIAALGVAAMIGRRVFRKKEAER
ncbi:MAG: hydrogen gas-evolving membrane-bound hydrogenase subunit E [Verrucomicrobiota bacterium]